MANLDGSANATKVKAIDLLKSPRYSGLVDRWTQLALTQSKKDRYLHPLPYMEGKFARQQTPS
ncbi:MAG: hypothetical protein UH850_15045 [Paludibacteraceae bacterium]|nr:hypothetical protein [Paludibacteraceae bacterium]